MNKNVLIVLGGAVVVAGLVAMLVQVTLGGGNEVKEIKEARVQILVASKDLGIGRELQDGDLAWQEWPESTVFPGAIKREGEQTPEDALEGRLARNIAQGEPIPKAALLGEMKGNFVAALLKPGQRAMAIEVSASSTAGGFVGPGDHVDVILTYRESIRFDGDDPEAEALIEANLDKMATETILQNIRVLAIDQQAERKSEKVKVGRTVTVAVTAQQAEELSLAKEIGDITLALRGVGDDVMVEKAWPTISDARLTSVADEIMLEYKKIKKGTGFQGNSMRIYNGANVQLVNTQ